MRFIFTMKRISSLARSARNALSVYALVRAQSAVVVSLLVLQRSHQKDVYNILWAVVFGFATLNILSLAARHFEPNRRGLTFGEMMAVLMVMIAIFLLGWELLSMMHIFPIQLRR
jgi:cytochrome bd-type quinol oxidase subunit 2